jgi:hypothetical protein
VHIFIYISYILEIVYKISPEGNCGLDQKQKEDGRTVNQSRQVRRSIYGMVEGDATGVEEW